MVLPSTCRDPGYPYERLTSKEIADIQRMRDNQIRKLRHENEGLRDELYTLHRWRRQLQTLLEEMGIDPDVLLATAELFKGPNKA